MSALRSAAVPVCLLAALTIGLAEVDSQAASVTYALVIDEIRDLGVPYRFLSSEAHAINENGAIAGSGENEFGTRRAMFWATPTSNRSTSAIGKWIDEAQGHERCRRRGGHEFRAGRFSSRGFRWTQSSGMSDLGLLDAAIGLPIDGFDAIDINNDGVIIGNTQNRTWNGTGYVLSGAPRSPCLVPAMASCCRGSERSTTTGTSWKRQLLPGQSSVTRRSSLSEQLTVALRVRPVPDRQWVCDQRGWCCRRRLFSNSSSYPYRVSMVADRWFPGHPSGGETTSASGARGINDRPYRWAEVQQQRQVRQRFVYTPGLKMKTLPGLCSALSWTSASRKRTMNNSGWIVQEEPDVRGRLPCDVVESPHRCLWLYLTSSHQLGHTSTASASSTPSKPALPPR